MTDVDDQAKHVTDHHVATWDDVRRLQGMTGIEGLTIDARTIKFDGLLPVALRRAFAAVMPGTM